MLVHTVQPAALCTRMSKYILVVGASSGMGAAVAKTISNDETTVILMARREEQLRLVQKELRGEFIVYACDVCDYSQIGSFFDFLEEKKILLSAITYIAGVICKVREIKAEINCLFPMSSDIFKDLGYLLSAAELKFVNLLALDLKYEF